MLEVTCFKKLALCFTVNNRVCAGVCLDVLVELQYVRIDDSASIVCSSAGSHVLQEALCFTVNNRVFAGVCLDVPLELQ